MPSALYSLSQILRANLVRIRCYEAHFTGEKNIESLTNMCEVIQPKRADLGLKFRVCDTQSWALLRHFAIFQGICLPSTLQKAEAAEIRKERPKGCVVIQVSSHLFYGDLLSSCKY